MPEAACTSTQLHVQTSPDQFAAYWNASQVISSVQLALGANSPYLLGKELWRETRIPLFEQATDTRSAELEAQGVRPRVWFGERWITSVFDLFEENVRYFPALLPILDDHEDPLTVLEAGGTPSLAELKLHNGTVYRWNRPVYDIAHGVPHLRVENRVLAAGPTVADTMANAAFYFGLVRYLADHERPLWSQMSFSAAEENFHVAARDGIEALVYWPGVGQVRATELVLRKLLPQARAGLDAWGVPSEESDRLLGIIEQRCLTGVNGAEWFVGTHARPRRGRPVRRAASHAAGVPRADAHQRAGPHLGLSRGRPIRRSSVPLLGVGPPVSAPQCRRSRTQCWAAPLRGSRHPCRFTTTIVSAAPRSACAAQAAASQPTSRSCRSSSPGRVSQTIGSGSAAGPRWWRASIAATTSVRSAWSSRPATGTTPSWPPGCPTCSSAGWTRRRSVLAWSSTARRSRRRSVAGRGSHRPAWTRVRTAPATCGEPAAEGRGAPW